MDGHDDGHLRGHSRLSALFFAGRCPVSGVAPSWRGAGLVAVDDVKRADIKGLGPLDIAGYCERLVWLP